MSKSGNFGYLRIAALALILLSAVGFLFTQVEELLHFWFKPELFEYIDELAYFALPDRWLLAAVAAVRMLLLLPRKVWGDILSGFFGIISTAWVLLIPTILEAEQLIGGLGTYYYALMPLGYAAVACCGLSAVLTVILAIKNR